MGKGISFESDLYKAIKSSDVSKVRKILDEKIFKDATERSGTHFFPSSDYDTFQIGKLVMKNPPKLGFGYYFFSPMDPSDLIVSPLYLACERDEEEIVKLLLSAFVREKIQKKSGDSSHMMKRSLKKIYKDFLTYGKRTGRTEDGIGIKKKKKKKLRKNSDDSDDDYFSYSRNKNEIRSPLFICAKKGYTNIARLLIDFHKKHLDENFLMKRYITRGICIQTEGYIEESTTGGDPGSSTWGEKKSPLDFAKKYNQQEMIEYLESIGHEYHNEVDPNIALGKIRFSDIESIRHLGEDENNGDSLVFYSRWNNLECAVKHYRMSFLFGPNFHEFRSKLVEEFRNEIDVLRSSDHPNILKIYGVTIRGKRAGNIGIVSDYCENGNLLEFLKKKRDEEKKYPMVQKIRVLGEIVSSMEYIHSDLNIVHKDLRLQSILMDKNETVKLRNFGVAPCFNEKKKKYRFRKEKIRDPYTIYDAPEIWNEVLLLDKVIENEEKQKFGYVSNDKYREMFEKVEKEYVQKSDVFSFAILAYLLVTENFELADEFKKNDSNNYSDPNQRPGFSETVLEEEEHEWLKEVIMKCWSHECDERYSFKELKEIFVSKAQGDSCIYEASTENENVVEEEQEGEEDED